MTVSPSGEVETPVTVVLMSDTVPRIRLTLNAWKYRHCQKDSLEEYAEHQRYHYNEHTCPTNYLGQVEEIAVEYLNRGGWDTDPHGIFKFVSTTDGKWVDPDGMSYDEIEARTEAAVAGSVEYLSSTTEIGGRYVGAEITRDEEKA
jgi:hypothetical protein